MDNTISFETEAKKRNILLKTPPPEQILETPKETVYSGEFIHDDDLCQMFISPSDDSATINLIDKETGLPYANYHFDIYTLFLMTETASRMFTTLHNDGDLSYYEWKTYNNRLRNFKRQIFIA